MRIIAVDDEELALERLMTAIQQAAPEAELHGFFYPEDVLAFLQNNGTAGRDCEGVLCAVWICDAE